MYSARRVQGGEAQVFQLHPNVVHAQPVGDGGVVVQGFPSDAAALLPGQHADGAHVVQPVGHLDQDDADVLGHGQGHLLEVLRLSLRLAAEHGGQLGHPIDQFRDRLAEAAAQAGLGHRGVFDHIVQQGRHDGLMIHAHLDQYGGHGQRVGDVGMARAPELAGMGIGGIGVGTANLLALPGGKVGVQQPDQRIYAAGRRDLVAPGPFRETGNEVGFRG